jgi:hypothetical protein
MFAEERDADVVKGCSYSDNLLEDLSAGSIRVHHLLNPGHLTRDTCQAAPGIVAQLLRHGYLS